MGFVHRTQVWTLVVVLAGTAANEVASASPAKQVAEQDRQQSIEVRLPADLLFDRSEDSPAPVVFRHWTHVALEGNRCLGCHPAPFRLVYPERSATHELMDAGASCGSCHDGTSAFGTTDEEACLFCHGDESPLAPLPPAPEGRLLGASELAPHEDSLGPVRFDHARHLTGPVPGHVMGASRCSTCHPEPFAMERGVSTASKEAMMEGVACGSCHDGSAAFGVDDERCERCHAEEMP